MVSVIIPCYNARQYICEALASAVAQEYVHEVILVDDCSTDDSVACVQAWLDVHAAQTADISIRVLQNAENSGVAVSRNRGVQEADGKYIAFLDADDRFAPGKLKKQVELLEQTGACLCNTARVLMTPDGSLTQTIMHTPEKITQHSEVHEDYLTWLQMLRAYPYAVGIDEPLLEYRLSAHGKSRNKLKSARMTYRTYRLAGYPVWKSCRMFLSYMINGLKKYATH